VPVQWQVRPALPHAIDPASLADSAAFLAAAFADAERNDSSP
jgi:hypothetical protein